MDNILGLVIYLAVSIFMISIGIFQLKSKNPVGFYSGEEPPREDEISDVKAWNRKHGSMWIIYGVIILISFGIGFLMGDTVWSIIPMIGGVILPIPLMILYHHRLVNKYLF